MSKEVIKVNPHAPIPGLEVEPVHQPSLHDQMYVDGRLMVSPLCIAPPVGYKKAPTLAEQMRDMIRSERLRIAAQEGGFETFEEADDFDVDDDYDPTSPFEEIFEPGFNADPRVVQIDEHHAEVYSTIEAAEARRAVLAKKEGDPAQPVPTAPTAPTPEAPGS